MANAFASLALGAAVAGLATVAMAAEPGQAPAFPPGATIGLPSGAAPPPGVYLRILNSAYDSNNVDGDGKRTGTHAASQAITPSLLWVPGWELLGGKYYAAMLVPFVHLDIKGGPAPTHDITGAGNPMISPLNISWMLQPGLFVSAGVGYYPKWGTEVIRDNFAVYEGTAAISYLRDGWDISLHAVYNKNDKNTYSNYTTGDRLYLNFTATKSFDKFEVGPVAYYDIQTTDDKNAGFAYGPFKPTFGREQKLGVGGLVGYDFGRFAVKAYLTTDVYSRNAAQGTKGWLALSLPLWMDPSKLPPGGHP